MFVAFAFSANIEESDKKMADKGDNMFTDAKDIAVTVTDKESTNSLMFASLVSHNLG